MVTDKTLGFIGAGNMGEALLKGLLNTKAARPEQILVSARRPERVQELVRAYGVRGGENGDVIILDIDGPGDTTVRPASPEMLPYLMAEREKLERWQAQRTQSPPTDQPDNGSDPKTGPS